MKKIRIVTVCILSACGWALLLLGQWQATIAVFSVATVIEFGL